MMASRWAASNAMALLQMVPLKGTWCITLNSMESLSTLPDTVKDNEIYYNNRSKNGALYSHQL
jgi:hypothetical protein